MRIRTIKPEFWRSNDIAALSVEDRLLFIGLWSYVDDNGVGRDEPQLIQCDLYPLDIFTEGSVRVHAGLKHLSQRGLITRYEGPNGHKYLQVNNWAKHQKINRPSKPRFPRYDAENCTLTEPSVSPHCTLTEGSPLEQGTGNREQGFLVRATKSTTRRTRALRLRPCPLTRTRQPRTSRSLEAMKISKPRSLEAMKISKPRSEPERLAGLACPTGGCQTRPSWTGPEPTPPPQQTQSSLSGSATTGNRSQGSELFASTGQPRGATGRASARNKPTSPRAAQRPAAQPAIASTAGSPSPTASTPHASQPSMITSPA